MSPVIFLISLYAVGVAAISDRHFWTQDVHDFPSGSLLQTVQPNITFTVRYGGVTVEHGTSLSEKIAKYSPNVTLEGDGVFTLMLTDPDAPSPKHPKWANVLHWLLVNVPGSEIKQAREVLSYMKPSPPKGTHRYIFRLYRQAKGRAISVVDVPERKHFDVHAWEEKYDLQQPVAVRSFTVSAADGSAAADGGKLRFFGPSRQFEMDTA